MEVRIDSSPPKKKMSFSDMAAGLFAVWFVGLAILLLIVISGGCSGGEGIATIFMAWLSLFFVVLIMIGIGHVIDIAKEPGKCVVIETREGPHKVPKKQAVTGARLLVVGYILLVLSFPMLAGGDIGGIGFVVCFFSGIFLMALGGGLLGIQMRTGDRD